MKTSLKTISLLASAAFFTLSNLSAVETVPVGYITTDLIPGADNFVSVPLKAAPEFTGAVDSTTDGAGTLFIVNAQGSPDFEDFGGTHYIRFLDNAAEGKFFGISENGSSQLTIDSLGDDLSGVVQGDRFEIVKFWTLKELFDPATQDSLVVSTGNMPFQRGSQVLLPDIAGVGRNRAPKNSFFITSTEWRRSSDFSNADDVVLMPGTYFIVRQDADAGSKNLTISGTVPTEVLAAYVYEETVDNDTLLTHGRPSEVRLDELGLGSEFVDSTGNLPFQRNDHLLVWENPTGRNPAPDSTYFRVGGEWRRSSDFSPANDVKIGPHTAFIIRKKGKASPVTKVWKNNPTY